MGHAGVPVVKQVTTRDIDHLAIVTDELPTAMDFYTRVPGSQS